MTEVHECGRCAGTGKVLDMNPWTPLHTYCRDCVGTGRIERLTLLGKIAWGFLIAFALHVAYSVITTSL